MEWFNDLLFKDGVAHTVLLYAFIIAAGVMLGKIKFFGISLGVTFILFVGLAVGHFGWEVNDHVLHFIREFGLILFVFSIGLQVGPGFFSSFKKGGMQMNLLAVTVVLLGVSVAIGIFYSFNGKISLPMIVGIMSGAVTNTPGLGAAQEALTQLHRNDPIALGYAVAYPLGVVGIILALILLRFIFKINLTAENDKIAKAKKNSDNAPVFLTIQLNNQNINGKTLRDIKAMIKFQFVASRLTREGIHSVPVGNTVLQSGDILYVVAVPQAVDAVTTLLGKQIEFDWQESKKEIIARQIVVTKNNVNGKTINDFHFHKGLGVNITRIRRAGIDLVAEPNLVLQVGDRVTVVGEIDTLKKMEDLLGNTLKRLDTPHLFSLFVGILAGVIFGSIPFYFPNMPMPVKLGLAGGPLVIAILLGRFGYKLKLITYTTSSANLMLREIGISLFLASVGLSSGGKFVETVVQGDGLLWVVCGFLITIIPLLVVGFIGRKAMKINYFSLMGLLSGSMTDPPALAYSNSIADNDTPAVAYSTVYPLTMFLRVISAQLIILLLA